MTALLSPGGGVRGGIGSGGEGEGRSRDEGEGRSRSRDEGEGSMLPNFEEIPKSGNMALETREVSLTEFDENCRKHLEKRKFRKAI